MRCLRFFARKKPPERTSVVRLPELVVHGGLAHIHSSDHQRPTIEIAMPEPLVMDARQFAIWPIRIEGVSDANICDAVPRGAMDAFVGWRCHPREDVIDVRIENSSDAVVTLPRGWILSVHLVEAER